MSVHTRRRHTRLVKKRVSEPLKKRTIQHKREKSSSWRAAAKDDIQKYTEVGLMIRGARFKAELTQRQLAEKLLVLPHHISEMEHGKRPISKKMAHKLAETLDVHYKVFL